MHRLRALGVALAAVSVGGYVVAIWVDYPGRAFTITLFMVAVTLVAIAGGETA